MWALINLHVVAIVFVVGLALLLLLLVVAPPLNRPSLC